MSYILWYWTHFTFMIYMAIKHNNGANPTIRFQEDLASQRKKAGYSNLGKNFNWPRNSFCEFSDISFKTKSAPISLRSAGWVLALFLYIVTFITWRKTYCVCVRFPCIIKITLIRCFTYKRKNNKKNVIYRESIPAMLASFMQWECL